MITQHSEDILVNKLINKHYLSKSSPSADKDENGLVLYKEGHIFLTSAFKERYIFLVNISAMLRNTKFLEALSSLPLKSKRFDGIKIERQLNFTRYQSFCFEIVTPVCQKAQFFQTLLRFEIYICEIFSKLSAEFLLHLAIKNIVRHKNFRKSVWQTSAANTKTMFNTRLRPFQRSELLSLRVAIYLELLVQVCGSALTSTS